MKLKTFAMSTAAAAMIAGGALAQETTTEADTTPMTDEMVVTDEMSVSAPTYESIEEMTVGDVLSMIAYDINGERIGDIDYVVQGANGPEAVVGIGGFLSLGEYTVAVPLDEFALNPDGTGFVLDTTEERLEQMPEFDETNAESLPEDVLISSLMDGAPMTEEEPATGDTVTQ